MGAYEVVGRAITRARRRNHDMSGPQLAAVAIDELNASGYRLVELPPPDSVSEWGWVWQSTTLGTFQSLPDGSIELRDDYERTYGAAELEQAAYAILAAVDAARDFGRSIGRSTA